MGIADIATLTGEIGALLGTVVGMVGEMGDIGNGARCQLRSEMLRGCCHDWE